MDKRVEYSARYAAHRDVANFIQSNLGGQETTFTYFSNQFVSDKEKTRYRRHLELLAARHWGMADRYMDKLMQLPLPPREGVDSER
jgi:hypothetical protein